MIDTKTRVAQVRARQAAAGLKRIEVLIYPADEQARAAGIRSKGQNAQCATVRCTFVDYVDSLHRDGVISDALASRATL